MIQATLGKQLATSLGTLGSNSAIAAFLLSCAAVMPGSLRPLRPSSVAALQSVATKRAKDLVSRGWVEEALRSGLVASWKGPCDRCRGAGSDPECACSGVANAGVGVHGLRSTDDALASGRGLGIPPVTTPCPNAEGLERALDALAPSPANASQLIVGPARSARWQEKQWELGERRIRVFICVRRNSQGQRYQPTTVPMVDWSTADVGRANLVGCARQSMDQACLVEGKAAHVVPPVAGTVERISTLLPSE